MGDFIEDYRVYTHPLETPDLFNFWCSLSALSAAAQRKIWFENGHLKIVPNLYVVMVAKPGVCRKSTAMSIVQQDLVAKIKSLKTNSDSITKEQIFQEMAEGFQQFEFKPPIQQGNIKMSWMTHCSYTLFANEMSVLIKEDKSFVGAITSLFDARDFFKHSTKHSKSAHCVFPYLNILGCTTPDWISYNIHEDVIEGGLSARTMLLYQEKPSKINPFPLITAIEASAYQRLILRMEQIATMGGKFDFANEETKKFYGEWYCEHQSRQPDNHRMSGYHNRKSVHLLKVSMLLSLARKNDLFLTIDDLTEGLEVLSYSEPAVEQALSGVGRNVLSAPSLIILEDVKRAPGGRILLSELYAPHSYQLPPPEFKEILESLQMQGLIVTKLDYDKKPPETWIIFMGKDEKK